MEKKNTGSLFVRFQYRFCHLIKQLQYVVLFQRWRYVIPTKNVAFLQIYYEKSSYF